jgi:hypothetical protein
LHACSQPTMEINYYQKNSKNFLKMRGYCTNDD